MRHANHDLLYSILYIIYYIYYTIYKRSLQFKGCNHLHIALTEKSAIDQVNGDVKQTDYDQILRRWDAYIIWDTEHT